MAYGVAAFVKFNDIDVASWQFPARASFSDKTVVWSSHNLNPPIGSDSEDWAHNLGVLKQD